MNDDFLTKTKRYLLTLNPNEVLLLNIEREISDELKEKYRVAFEKRRNSECEDKCPDWVRKYVNLELEPTN